MVEQQLGDLFQSRFYSTSGDELLGRMGLSKAETLYRSATDKLEVSEWNNCVSDTMFCDAFLIGGNSGYSSSNYFSQISGQVTRKRKKNMKDLTEQRITSRMITGSCKQRVEYAQNEVKGKCPQKVDCIATGECEVV